jgi:hypothetical protein
MRRIRTQFNTKRILNCRLPVPDPDPPIRIQLRSMNFFTYRRDILRVQKYCFPQAVEKSGADCVQNSVKNSVVPTITNIMKGTKLFWNLSHTIYPQFLCSGTLWFVLYVYRYVCMCMWGCMCMCIFIFLFFFGLFRLFFLFFFGWTETPKHAVSI